jgi:hypothetical protein
VDEIGTEKYLQVLCKTKVELTEELTELGPVLRLALLFKMINSRTRDVAEKRLFVACEIFSNLSMIDDLKLLDIIDLGDHGKDYYAGLG